MLSSRLNNITPSYTIGISSKVRDLKTSGKSIIDLSIGEPDLSVPNAAIQHGINSLNENLTNYDLVPGLKILRDELSKKLNLENDCDYAPEEIVVSSGAKNAITNALLAVLNPGDDVLVPKPYWVSYPEMIKLVNANPVFIETNKENEFKLTKDILEKSITPKTRMLFLNNPSNPTGAVYSKEELLEIANVCIKNNIYILADEIYERICYKDKFVSIASLSNDIKNITITINGFSKSFAMTGLRIGYSASNKEIAKAISTIQGHLVSHPSLTSQYIAYGALKDCSDSINDMVDIYRSRRNKVVDILNQCNKLNYVTPDGAFYTFIDLSMVKNNLNYTDSFSIEFCNKLLDEYEVAAVPGIAFGMDDYIRISYACSESSFTEGLKRIIKLAESL
ncbi:MULTISPECIES: pyridoxal phosphate-dependent aminotransferase [Paraclostridium]|uniref:Aminotransferase n=1 Tax=Paraclostridium bifermentans TaxID=1490 RepID=A0AA44DNX4_PARBF|nr:pyridoxal phosphate-dependent aminotransferase [Paraclostridium bifermentans]MBN8049543.1 pyridoxal phosphate-dependent aminotransferase [Paraclostridium bifermentans]MCE9677523.1 pyridoxal phosphate-dependent aminotransferase [Paraclostridium bifermentans]MCR1877353.1 pyridoxal phosphate-dependent aminotransferase [Paraclostridium bifermentans]NME11237.1 pyridoxal phosphate-dependent aminotransferase [Paraclostridium bifermentans]